MSRLTLAGHFIRRELLERYRGSFTGFGWALLQPFFNWPSTPSFRACVKPVPELEPRLCTFLWLPWAVGGLVRSRVFDRQLLPADIRLIGKSPCRAKYWSSPLLRQLPSHTQVCGNPVVLALTGRGSARSLPIALC